MAFSGWRVMKMNGNRSERCIAVSIRCQRVMVSSTQAQREEACFASRLASFNNKILTPPRRARPGCSCWIAKSSRANIGAISCSVLPCVLASLRLCVKICVFCSVLPCVFAPWRLCVPFFRQGETCVINANNPFIAYSSPIYSDAAH